MLEQQTYRDSTRENDPDPGGAGGEGLEHSLSIVAIDVEDTVSMKPRCTMT